MTREDRAITIVELLTQAMAAIDHGEQAEQLVCTTLAKASHAESAALIGLDVGHKLHLHAAWPDQRHATVLAEFASHGHRTESQLHIGQHPVLGEVVTIGPELDQHANLDRARVLAFARRGGFSPEGHALFAESVAPLTLLLPHVAEACGREQSVRTAAEAAAALNLTAREVEVLQLLAEGLLARTIAARLGLSPRTVHKHLSNVYSKLGVHDRLVAVSIARAQGLIAA
ncbi:MAG: LuxR C-terminal-related transcriptional regulator [Propionicimonas sp.]|uniref:helix-turn-helix transcriptional regulator n=1 Tax=Propionicimonas sp. TaxID=1955623 RepID=UPI003D123845